MPGLSDVYGWNLDWSDVLMTQINKKIRDQIALEGLVQEVNAGTIEGYGRELLHRHMRRAGYIVPRLEYDFLSPLFFFPEFLRTGPC